MKFSVPALVNYINDEGLEVNNCFQLDDGTWRVNLRRRGAKIEDDFYCFADGETMKEALFNALEKAL